MAAVGALQRYLPGELQFCVNAGSGVLGWLQSHCGFSSRSQIQAWCTDFSPKRSSAGDLEEELSNPRAQRDAAESR
uniref:Uncharacterized protein n=1 Tax=Cyanistes caeruleus TaxID=156563 RepID=A0A8C0V5R6_CYACU